jgi:hypothetical protein
VKSEESDAGGWHYGRNDENTTKPKSPRYEDDSMVEKMNSEESDAGGRQYGRNEKSTTKPKSPRYEDDSMVEEENYQLRFTESDAGGRHYGRLPSLDIQSKNSKIFLPICSISNFSNISKYSSLNV